MNEIDNLKDIIRELLKLCPLPQDRGAVTTVHAVYHPPKTREQELLEEIEKLKKHSALVARASAAIELKESTSPHFSSNKIFMNINGVETLVETDDVKWPTERVSGRNAAVDNILKVHYPTSKYPGVEK